MVVGRRQSPKKNSRQNVKKSANNQIRRGPNRSFVRGGQRKREKAPSAEELDRELLNYKGQDAMKQHLDQELDGYFEKKDENASA